MMLIISAPAGMARPSDRASMKSSQQSFQGPTPIISWKGTHTPLLPRPSTATRAASTMMATHTQNTVLERLPCLPLLSAWSSRKVTTTSIRAMAEEMAATSTNR